MVLAIQSDLCQWVARPLAARAPAVPTFHFLRLAPPVGASGKLVTVCFGSLGRGEGGHPSPSVGLIVCSLCKHLAGTKQRWLVP